MEQYYKLYYITTLNKIKANLQALNPNLVKHIDIKIKDKVALKILYGIFVSIKFIIKKIIWFGIIIPIITCIILKLIGLHNIENIFKNYYYFALIFFQAASKISKSKILSAGEIEYYYIKIFRYSKKKFIHLKKKIALLEMLAELPVIAFVMYDFQYNIRIIVGNLLIIALIDCSLTCLFMESVYKIKSKYLKLKYISAILSNILIPLVGISLIYNQNIKPFNSSLGLILTSSFCIIIEIIILCKNRNEELLCRLILQQYYYDNSLLESLERDKLTVGLKKDQVNRAGYDYFNYIFFSRHKQIILKSFFWKSVIVLVISLMCGLFFTQATITQWRWLISLFPFILYQLSVSSKICEMFWRNCDISMSNHSFYTRSKFRKQLEKHRLKWLLTINMGLAVICLGIFFLIISISYNFLPVNHLIFLSIIILTIMLFHTLFDFWIYCCIKPYANKKFGKLLGYLYKGFYFIILGAILLVIENIYF